MSTKNFLAYRNFKIDHLLRKRRHWVFEAEPIISQFIRREDEVALPFFHILQDNLIAGAEDRVIDVKWTTRLDLK